MASQIDPTVFPDNQQVDKADLRTEFQIAATEITALQLQVTLARKMMTDDNLWSSL